MFVTFPEALCFIINWTASSEFGSYRLCEQRRFRRDCAVSPEPSLLAHTSSEWRGTFRQKARSLAPLNGWTCAVKICHDGMLEDTNSHDGAQLEEKWAGAWQNQQNDLCAQWRVRSAWASAQSDQSSLLAWRNLGSLATHWARWSESSLGTQVILLIL